MNMFEILSTFVKQRTYTPTSPIAPQHQRSWEKRSVAPSSRRCAANGT